MAASWQSSRQSARRNAHHRRAVIAQFHRSNESLRLQSRAPCNAAAKASDRSSAGADPITGPRTKRKHHGTEAPKVRHGTLVVLEHTSKVLKGNALGDPFVRKLGVWLPPQYDEGNASAASRCCMTWSFQPDRDWRMSTGSRSRQRAGTHARLIHEEKIGPATSCFPTVSRRSVAISTSTLPALGQYADYITREIVPFVDREFRTLAAREHRGCFGKSSGGYGAILHGMKYAKDWGAWPATPAMPASTSSTGTTGRTR